MTNGIRRTATVVASVVVSMYVGAVAVMASPTPESVIGDGAESVKDSLITIAGTVLPYAAAILAITIGWRFAKRFVRGG